MCNFGELWLSRFNAARLLLLTISHARQSTTFLPNVQHNFPNDYQMGTIIARFSQKQWLILLNKT